jgi:hypothetical protein
MRQSDTATDTPFPQREDAEETYTLINEYKKLFNTVLVYAREWVQDETGPYQRQRVRWWSALALLRGLTSSPAAAAVTLYTCSSTADTESSEEVYAIGKRSVLGLGDQVAEVAALIGLGLAFRGNVENTIVRSRLEQALSIYRTVGDIDSVPSIEAILAKMEVTK